MSSEFFPRGTLIDLTEPKAPKVISGELVEMTDGSRPPQLDSLVEENVNRRAPEAKNNTGQRIAIPETRPLDEYTDPLTHELMEERYTELYSANTEGGLCNNVIGSEAYEAARRKGKQEITSKILHKSGLPSDFIKYLDFDEHETRDLLDEIFFSIPEDVARDNSVNSFDHRSTEVKNHILHMHQDDPDIAERLQSTIDIWREDLLLRAQIMAGDTKPEGQLVQQRRTDLELLMEYPDSPRRNELIAHIGNTLLHATPAEKTDFLHEAERTKPQTEQAVGALSLLVGYIKEYHPGE